MESDRITTNIKFARDAARNILSAAKIKTIPISLDDIVTYLQKKHNMTVCPWPLDPSVSGIQISEDSNSCAIAFNEQHHIHRQRLTIAHEIGHFVLGHTREKDLTKFKPNEVQENEAYEFAGELLMPLAILKSEIKTKPTIEVLAKKFLVSKDALTVRIMKTGLINKM